MIVLRPLLMLPMKYRWPGKEYLPRTGGAVLVPNHLSYTDWPSVAWFSYVYVAGSGGRPPKGGRVGHSA